MRTVSEEQYKEHKWYRTIQRMTLIIHSVALCAAGMSGNFDKMLSILCLSYYIYGGLLLLMIDDMPTPKDSVKDTSWTFMALNVIAVPVVVLTYSTEFWGISILPGIWLLVLGGCFAVFAFDDSRANAKAKKKSDLPTDTFKRWSELNRRVNGESK